VGAILAAAERAMGLTRQLLAFSRRRPPVARAEARSAAIAGRATPAAPWSVLFVDDHEAVRLLAREVLEAQGYEVLEARQGSEAVGIVERRGGAVDLVITDLVLLDMSGPTLKERLLVLAPGIQALFLTGVAGNEEALAAVLPKDALVLAKPYTPEELARSVREVARDRGA
jgi:CheY-like chemotaxis protein